MEFEQHQQLAADIGESIAAIPGKTLSRRQPIIGHPHKQLINKEYLQKDYAFAAFIAR